MLVCHCFAIRDAAIRTAIAGGARSANEIARTCGAGAGCGGCRALIDELIDAHACAPAAHRSAAFETEAGERPTLRA